MWFFFFFNCTPGKPKKIKENPRLMTVFCFEPLVWTAFWTTDLKCYDLDGFLQNYIGPNVLVPLFTISSFTRIKVSSMSQGKIAQWMGDRWILFSMQLVIGRSWYCESLPAPLIMCPLNEKIGKDFWLPNLYTKLKIWDSKWDRLWAASSTTFHLRIWTLCVAMLASY